MVLVVVLLVEYKKNTKASFNSVIKHELFIFNNKTFSFLKFICNKYKFHRNKIRIANENDLEEF